MVTLTTKQVQWIFFFIVLFVVGGGGVQVWGSMNWYKYNTVVRVLEDKTVITNGNIIDAATQSFGENMYWLLALLISHIFSKYFKHFLYLFFFCEFFVGLEIVDFLDVTYGNCYEWNHAKELNFYVGAAFIIVSLFYRKFKTNPPE